MDLKIINKICDLNEKLDAYRTRQIMLIILDTLIVSMSSTISMKLNGVNLGDGMLIPILIYTLFNLILFYKLGCYSSLWNLGGEKEVANIFISSMFSLGLTVAIYKLIGYKFNILYYVVTVLMVIVATIGSRVVYRITRRVLLFMSINNEEEVSRVLIVGAGSAGNLIIEELIENRDMCKLPVAIVDDDPKKIGKNIYGIPVLGNCKDINKVVKEKQIDEIIFSIANINRDKKVKIINYCKETKCKLKTIPGIYEIIEGKVDIKKIRDVNIEDLLARDAIKTNLEEISQYLNEKTVLVTGGGGSIGSELCRQVSKFSPKRLVILDIYENNAYEIQQELTRKYGNELNLDVVIGSVRDEKRIDFIMKKYKPEVVFHAAAHKHVPLMEKSPSEAIKNNIFGTLNVARKASQNNVKKFVLISTDKAVNPTNIMGATKRCCEMIIQTLNKYSKTEFVAVRFGNVLGSNGSVIPLFKKQIEEGGPVKVTHPEITRFFMTIPEAVSLVIEAGAMAKGGEIFVLDMGEPVKILDLARNLITLSGLEPNVDIKIEFTGLRPGEKLYEELLMKEEGLSSTQNNKIFVGKPIDIDESNFKKHINELEQHVEKDEYENVRDTLKKIVHTYKEEQDIDIIEEIAVSS